MGIPDKQLSTRVASPVNARGAGYVRGLQVTSASFTHLGYKLLNSFITRLPRLVRMSWTKLLLTCRFPICRPASFHPL